MNAAPGNTDDCILGSVAGCKSVDRCVFNDINRGHRGARGNGYFLHDVENFFLIRIVSVQVDQAAIHGFGNGAAATSQLQLLVDSSQSDYCPDGKTDPRKHLPGDKREQVWDEWL